MRRTLKNIEDKHIAKLQEIAADATRSAYQRAVEILPLTSGGIVTPPINSIQPGRKVEKGTVFRLNFNKQKKSCKP